MAIDNEFRTVEEQGISVMKDVFGPVLNRDIEIEIQKMDEADSEALAEMFTEHPVVVEVPIESTAEGSLYFLFSQKLAAAITDLMVMGDGTAEFNEHESLDGVAEAVNQIVGAQSTWWGDEWQVNISFGGAQGSLRDASALDMNFSDLVEVQFKMDISDWGDDTFVKLTPKGVLEVLAGAVDGVEVGGGDEDVASSRFSAPSGGDEPSPAPRENKSARPVQFGEFDDSQGYQLSPDDPKNLDLLMDISLPVTIELGRTQMLIKDVLEIGPGSVIELQKLSGEPVDLYINEKRFALGEVVVIDENFGIRITELLSVEDRIKALK
jgi:flagellar motor switch protein FliN/FliY